MARLKLYKDNYIESTAVSNCFIDNYMQDANDAQLKVYLYLLRMIAANLPTSVSDIADKFNHTEKDVLRALKFWEKKKLLSLDFDENKNLVGVHLCHMTSQGENMGTALSLQTRQEPAIAVQVPEVPVQAENTVAFPVAGETTEEAEAENPFAKPNYTADMLRRFKEKEETQQLLFAAQMYVGKPLTATDMKTILYISDVLHFSDELIDYLIQYCVDRDKKDFRYMEKVALNWAEQEITTVKQAKKIATKYDKNVYAIMNGLGKNTSPTLKEVEFIHRWMREYDFSQEIILEACDRTVLATDKHRFEYADGILSSWRKAGVHHKSDIEKLDKAHAEKKTTGNAVSNKFNKFQQNQYDFAALEEQLLSN